MRVYATQLARKYDHLQPVTDGDASVDRQMFTSPEGDLMLSLVDKTLFISEGFQRPLARQLEIKMRDVQGVGPIQSAAMQGDMPRGELALGGAAMLHVAGGVTLPLLHQAF